MAGSPLACVECGQAIEVPNKHLVCDDCLARLDPRLRAEQLRRANARPISHPRGEPLSQDELDERVRHLLNDW
jgi:NMD protein affecting ribosome stability and mRNA decay